MKKIALDFKLSHKSEKTPDYYNTNEDLFADMDFGNFNLFKENTMIRAKTKSFKRKKTEEIKEEIDFGEFENVPIQKQETQEEENEINLAGINYNVEKEKPNFEINIEKETQAVLDFFNNKPIVQVIK